MNFIVLGSGTSIPHPARSSSGYWLETAGGTLLLDCSCSVIHRMAREHLDWPNLDAIWISHFHLDHVGGIPSLLSGLKHAADTRDRVKPLKIFGPAGLRRIMEGFENVNQYKFLKLHFPVELIEIEEHERFEILPDLEAVALSTPHTAESQAIRVFDKSGKSIVYSSDTGFTKSVGEFARNADLFVCECSFFENKPTQNHLVLAEAMFLARYGSPKRIMLTHLYPAWDGFDIIKEAEKFSPMCEVIEAKDGLRLEF